VCALKFEDMIWRADGQVPVQLQVAWGKGRIVPLTPQATAALAGWLPHHPDWQPDERGRELSVEAPLFVTLGSPKPARQAIIETGLLRQVLRYAQQAGIPAHLCYPYVLRHYWATQQVARGITPASCRFAAGGGTAAVRRRSSNGPRCGRPDGGAWPRPGTPLAR
jgi:integrase